MRLDLLNRPGPARKQRAQLAVKLRRKPKGRDYLERATGRDSVGWVLFIQETIAAGFEPNPADPDHPISDPREWAHALIDEVWEHRPSHGDENMWMAAALAVATGTWVVRIQRAKAFDPHRPIALRKAGYERWLSLTRALHAITTDESRDPEMFPGQPWESPFVKGATDGRFV